MNDDAIIKQRIAGKSVRAIAKTQRCSVGQVNEAIDRWAASKIDDKTRRNTLALELARLDEIQETLLRACSRRRCSKRGPCNEDHRTAQRAVRAGNADDPSLADRRGAAGGEGI
jgi:hypothetical protein